MFSTRLLLTACFFLFILPVFSMPSGKRGTRFVPEVVRATRSSSRSISASDVGPLRKQSQRHRSSNQTSNSQIEHVNAPRQQTQSARKSNNGFPFSVKAFMVEDRNGLCLLAPSTDTHISTQLLRNRQWEPKIQDFFYKIIRPGHKVVCLGGHIGTHALLISRLVGAQGCVFVFEPNPNTLPFLRANIAWNNTSNITLYPFAAFSKNTELPFSQDKKNTGASHTLGRVSEAACTCVQAVAIDSLQEVTGPIDVLQMDIEGREIDAVKGMEALIARSPNLVVIQEWSPTMYKNINKDAKAYLTFWRDKGYQVARFDAVEKFTLMQDEDLISMKKHQCDIVMAKDLSTVLLSMSMPISVQTP